MGAFADWLVHTVSVRTFTGATDDGGRGWADPVEVACWIEDRVVLARSADGSTVQVGTLLHFEDLSQAPLFELGSLVTLRGREAEVVTRSITESTTGDDLDGVVVGLA